VPVLPTFYEQFFFTKMLCAAFSASIFWLDEIGKKAFDKMLMKLKGGGLSAVSPNDKGGGVNQNVIFCPFLN